MSKLSVVIPCYYNEGSIPELGKELLAEEPNFPESTEIEYIFIDDHSGDRTLEQLLEFKSFNPDRVKVITLKENVGSYKAMVIGVGYAQGDCIAIMAADQQDPPSLLTKMLTGWEEGSGLVIAYREKLEGDWSSRLFTKSFHYLMGLFVGSDSLAHGFDMVLFDRKLFDKIESDPRTRVNLFYNLLRIEKEPTKIPYTKRTREHGHSMWTFSKKSKHLFKSLFYFFPFPYYKVLGNKSLTKEDIIDAVL